MSSPKQDVARKIEELASEVCDLPDSSTKQDLEGLISKLNKVTSSCLSADGSAQACDVPSRGNEPQPIILGDGYFFCC